MADCIKRILWFLLILPTTLSNWKSHILIKKTNVYKPTDIKKKSITKSCCFVNVSNATKYLLYTNKKLKLTKT